MEKCVLIVPGLRGSGPGYWQTLRHAKHRVAAQGFGCLATLACLARRNTDAAGVLLVAPRHPDEFGLVPQRLDIPSILVASRTDPCLTREEAHRFARALGARFVDAGDAGHIDGPWRQGERWLARLFAMAEARERGLAAALALSS